jgi:tetratricopeptide (TPR) repeat protein
MRALKKIVSRLLPLLLVAASTNLPPEELYARGGFLAAAEAGARIGDGSTYALAARATIADATLRDLPCLECLRRAQELARLGITQDSNFVDNHIMLAAAIGYEARLIGAIRARLANYPSASKEAIDTALKLAPHDPLALSVAGGWNIEVVRTAGSLLGNLLYGASFEKGVAYYRQAIAGDPGNLVIQLNYALSVSSYDFEGKRLEIMAVLEAAARSDPFDAYSQAMRGRAAILHDLLLREDYEEYQALARRYLGFADTESR